VICISRPSMTAKGHEDAFPRLTLSARFRFSQRTFAGAHGNGRDAPIPVVELPENLAGIPPSAIRANPAML